MGQKFITYLRVSTQGQGDSGLGLEAQRAAVTAYARQAEGTITAEFLEVESGKRSDRPQLAAALARCRKTHATLLIAKLDRLARNVRFITGLMESVVPFIAADCPHDDRMMLQIRAVFAEEEARKVSARTREALAAAKARGVKLGSPTPQAGAAVVKAQAATRDADVLPVIGAIRETGVVTLAGIAEELTKRGVPTPRGGEWNPTGVRRVLVRSAAGQEA